MARQIPKVSPIEEAIHQMDVAIEDLKRRREELAALLPKRPHARARGYITDPRTGQRLHYGKRNGGAR